LTVQHAVCDDANRFYVYKQLKILFNCTKYNTDSLLIQAWA